jgi:signal transduction histidine kinase
MPELGREHFPIVLWIDDDPQTFRYVGRHIEKRGAEVFDFGNIEVLRNRAFLHHLSDIRKPSLICVTLRVAPPVEVLQGFLNNVPVTGVISDLEIGRNPNAGLIIISAATLSRYKPKTAIYSGRVDRSLQSLATVLGTSEIIKKGGRSNPLVEDLITNWLSLARSVRPRSPALNHRLQTLEQENRRLKKERSKLRQLLQQKEQNLASREKAKSQEESVLRTELSTLQEQMQLVVADHHDLINTSSLTVEALEQLAREPKYLPPVVVEELERARISAKHCDVLVSSLTTLSTQPERREIPEPSSLARALTEALQIVQRKVPDTVNLNSSIADQLPLSAVPEHLLVRCILNLLLNALEAVQEGGVIRLTVGKPKRNAKYLLLRISDDGIGIKKVDLSKVFERDFSTKGEQHGLGLFIVRKILNDYGGSVKLQSIRRKGTDLTLRIPIA